MKGSRRLALPLSELGKKLRQLRTHRLKREMLQRALLGFATIAPRKSAFFNKSSAIEAISMIVRPSPQVFENAIAQSHRRHRHRGFDRGEHRLRPVRAHGPIQLQHDLMPRHIAQIIGIRFPFLNYTEFSSEISVRRAIAALYIHPD